MGKTGFKTIEVNGFEGAITGMRAPLKSYAKSDSSYQQVWRKDETGSFKESRKFVLGKNDLDLATRLIKSGPEHRKFLRGITVTVAVTQSRSFLQEMDTYSTRLYANSESTMHTLGKDKITLDNFDYPQGVNENLDVCFKAYIDLLNEVQKKMNEHKKGTDEYEKYHQSLKAMLPESWIQTRYYCFNYETLRSMYNQRKNHRLPEWRNGFCDWVKTLPYSEFIIDSDK